jgi:fructuronate reductase
VKLRLRNAAHSLLAYTGALAGHRTIAEAVADPALAEAAANLMRCDAAPTLVAPTGLDLDAYQSTVLERFANPALRHHTVQVAADGSQKLPIRLLGTARDRFAAGGEPRWVALAVAAWMVYAARGTDRLGRPLPLGDPLAQRLTAALRPAPALRRGARRRRPRSRGGLPGGSGRQPHLPVPPHRRRRASRRRLAIESAARYSGGALR